MPAIRHVTSAAALLAGVFMAAPSWASIVNFNDTANFGTLSAGQSGEITNDLQTGFAGMNKFQTGTQSGYLAPDSEVTFTYTYSGLSTGQISTSDYYKYASGGFLYSGTVTGNTTTGLVTTSTANNVSSNPLLLAYASLNPAGTIGTLTIINNSISPAAFTTGFTGYFNNGGMVSDFNYVVSAVPLPPSLPLFATVLAALAGFSVWRKRLA